MRLMRCVILIFTAALMISGCAKHYRITHDLEQPITTGTACSIGEISDKLPPDVEPDDRPTLEQIQKIKGYLVSALTDGSVFSGISSNSTDAGYEVVGSILEYKKGSGALRYLIGFGAGNAKLTMELVLMDKQTDQVVFSGNFRQTVSSGYESGDKAYQRVAKDFAKELKKQMKKLQA